MVSASRANSQDSNEEDFQHPMLDVTPGEAQGRGESEFKFEIVRTDEEWRELLTEDEFKILRRGGTETPKSSELWEEDRDGTYHCKGCDLHVYSSDWKTILDKGWVFFAHCEPNSVLTGIDEARFFSIIEAHCRRCGSHLGHILYVEDRILHCINGTSLVFKMA